MKCHCRPSMVLIPFLVLGSLFLIVLPGTAQTTYPSTIQAPPQRSQFEIPPGWTVFRGQSGLIVTHPAGWQVQERGGGAFLAYRLGPGGAATALAMAAPMPRIDGQALGVAQGVGQIFPDLFPKVKIVKSRLLSQNPEVALAEMQYAPQGLPFRGLVMCFKKDNRGVLYAIAGSTSTWLQDEPVMKQILSRFFYSGDSRISGWSIIPIASNGSLE